VGSFERRGRLCALCKRTSGYVCRLGPRQVRGGRRTTASHQSRPRTLAPGADRSRQNPRRHARSSHTIPIGTPAPRA
jgi:hypothetical protein